MKFWEFCVSILLSLVALVFAALLIVSNQNNRRLEKILNTQQVIINEGQLSQQIGSAVVQDLAVVSVRNPKIKQLLADNGFTVTQKEQPPATPPAGTPVAP
jgi:hypothetical protein